MRKLYIWVREFAKMAGGQRLHPVVTQCPICHQTVRLHVNRAGRQHAFAHARSLYEGSSFRVHYVANVKCAGSGAPKVFDPRPTESIRFRLPEYPK
jgi:hypothetical protein